MLDILPEASPRLFTLTYALTFAAVPLVTACFAVPYMASILRTIVAGPRLQHDEAGLDLCYVSPSNPTIIAMSMPTNTYRKAYRNPLDEVVKFLDKKHGDNWAIWEFRAEGTGYKDEDVKNRIFHAPWPDHHPPPFALIPLILASMRNHLEGNKNAVAVVHCKAGKGRSGTVSCSYLIGEEGYSAKEAMDRFTAARMRPGFGNGISIPSQRRWIHYIERWTKELNKTYVERHVEIKEIHVWGLREGVRLTVQGYVDEGKAIKSFHTFHKKEIQEMGPPDENGNRAVIFKPGKTLILPTNDVNIDFEKRSRATYGWAMVTSIAHVWFNAFFEGDENSRVFNIEWEKMDGIKGSSRKGIQALDRLQVVWSVDHHQDKEIHEPGAGEIVSQPRKADTKSIEEPDLGLKKAADSPASSTSRVDGSNNSNSSSPAESKTQTTSANGSATSSSSEIHNQIFQVDAPEEPRPHKEAKFGSLKRQKK